QHRERESLGATNAISDRAEDQAAGRPTSYENGGRVSAPLLEQVGRRAWGHECGNGRIAGDNEKLLVETIEQPSQRRHAEDKPMITIKVLPPGTGQGDRRSGGSFNC